MEKWKKKKSQYNEAPLLKNMVGIQGNKMMFARQCLFPFIPCPLGGHMVIGEA